MRTWSISANPLMAIQIYVHIYIYPTCTVPIYIDIYIYIYPTCTVPT